MCLYASHWTGQKKDPAKRRREKNGDRRIWLNCPLSFSIWMIPLSWYNPPKICSFSIPALNISQWKNQFLSMHLNQVIGLLFKDTRAHSTLNKSQLQYRTWMICTYLCILFLHFSTKKKKNIPTPSQIWYPSYTPLGSWRTEGLLGLWSHWASEWDFSLGAS